MTTHTRHQTRAQRLNRAATLAWVAALFLMVDGFVFRSLPAVVVAVVLTVVGCWFANEAQA
jgi:hypothetical protein